MLFRSSDRYATCELSWKHFFPNKDLPEIVRLLGRYEYLGHEETKEKQKVIEFQYGAKQIISNYMEAYNSLVTSKPFVKLDATTADRILATGVIIHKYINRTYK